MPPTCSAPVNSNVRPHENRGVKSQEFRPHCQEQVQVLALARSSKRLSSWSNGNALAWAPPFTKSNANSSFATSRCARAARPLAGGSPPAVLGRNEILKAKLTVRQTG
jgi:hypothetical protein